MGQVTRRLRAGKETEHPLRNELHHLFLPDLEHVPRERAQGAAVILQRAGCRARHAPALRGILEGSQQALDQAR